jgi:hypothetical protein
VKIAGKKINNWWLVGGGAALVGVVFLYKRSASGSSTGTGSDPNSTDPLTGLPYSQDNQVDPITGMTYLQEAQQYGSVTAAQQEVTSGSAWYGVTGSGQATSGYPTISGVTDTGTTTGNSFSTNAQWAQAATAGLVSLGYSATDVAAALGLFFAQQPLGAGADGVSYASIVQAAEAEYGPPPQGTYAIIAQPSSGGTGGGSGGGGTGGGGTGGGGTGGGGTGGGGTGGGGHKKGISLNQPHAISNSAGTYLFQHPGHGGVYWKASDGSYVETHTGKGVGQLYTGADGWAYLKAHGKA